MARKMPDVLTGDIKRHMWNMAIPSMGGMFAITVFNLTDTYFVSRLGTDALAAMGFTFPVVMITGAFAGGISMGAGSVLARAMGRGDHHKMNRVATDGILLSLLFVFFVSLFGYMYVEELFSAFGAEGAALDLVVDYMSIWFLCAAVVIVPPVSDASMRAMGDMVRPFIVMMSVAVLNVILDPILIFGLFGFPEMGIRGAVVATVISRAVAGILSLSFVGFHYKLIDFAYKSLRELFESWRDILLIGVPNVATRLLPQAVRALMTWITAEVVGVAAVAAIAAGQRIESFATIASMGVGTAIIPIIGQNYGKGHMDRVMETRKILIRLAVVYGLILLAVILPFGRFFASIFTEDPQVLELTVTYLRIIIIGTIGLNQYNWLSEAFSAAGKPRYAFFINVVGTIVMIIPALYIGTEFGGFTGMVIGLTVGQVLVGLMAVFISKKSLV